MEIFQHILNWLNSVPSDVWSTLVEITVSAVIVSPVALGLKKWLKLDDPKRREKIMTVIVILGSMGMSALLYLTSNPDLAPWVIIVQGWLVYATTQPVYFFFVKPVSVRISAWFMQKVADYAITHEAKAAAVPPQGLPVAPVAPAEDDFSH